ncbi:TonB-dependent receptor [Hyphomonas atlantica]|uniref:TonB-dependent receptor n=1 Tax=Hyphomonas atlantica TaxID=1280948 RepID=UPI0035164570
MFTDLSKWNEGYAMRSNLLLSTMLTTSAAVLYVSPAFAQDAGYENADSSTSSEIIVSATRRNERIQDVAVAITALGESFLEDTGAQQLSDVVSAIPNLSVVPNGAGASVFTIRGVNSSSATSNIQAPVAVYIDDVPALDPFIPYAVPEFHLYDIERVETLRGPQGTLFGAGALGGAIRFITKKPDLDEVSFGTQESIQAVKHGEVGYEANAMVNIPLATDTLALRAVGYYAKKAGWIDNPVLGDKNGNSLKTYGGRAMLAWQAADNFKLTGSVMIDVSRPRDSAYTPYGTKGYANNGVLRNFTDNDSSIYNITSELDLSWVDITTNLTYLKRTAHQILDFSGTAIPVTGLPGSSPLLDDSVSDNYIQETRFASPDDQRLTWLVGVYYQNYKLDLREQISQPGVADLGYATDLLSDSRYTGKVIERALFGELGYKLTPELKFTVGARMFHQTVGTTAEVAIGGETLFDGPPGSAANGDKYKKVTPKFGLSYAPNRDLLIYATASNGYRAGQGNLFTGVDPVSNQVIPAAYGPDELWNYELGTKFSAFNGDLSVSADVYYIDWKKIPLEAFTDGLGLPYTDNVGDAEVKGAEIEIVARPVSQIETGASMAYAHARITAVRSNADALVGDQLPGGAPFTAYVYGQYNAEISNNTDAFIRASYSYTGKQYSYLNNPNSFSYGKYDTVSAQAGLKTGNYSIVLKVDNLFNGKGRVNARSLFGLPVQVLQTPRTIGATFNALF